MFGPDRERDMCVDAWFVERGVFKFERTTFVREHLLVDQARRVRVYVDDFDGTRYLVYFNHRIGRFILSIYMLIYSLLGLSHLGFEILQTYNLLFLSNWRSRRIAQRLGINISSLEQFDSIFIHQKLFDAPRVNEFLLFGIDYAFSNIDSLLFDLNDGGIYSREVMRNQFGVVWFGL